MRQLKRYTLPLILAVLALIMLTIGILAKTVWHPQQQVVASGDTDQPFTMTRAGVLRLYEPHQEVAGVRVEASVPDDSIIWLALGSQDDINAWLQDEPYDEIVGLSDLETLKVITHEGVAPEVSDEPAEEGEESEESEESAEEEEAENPLASDMWTAVKYGKHSVSLELTGDELDQSLLAATDGEGPAPTIQLSWQTPQENKLALWSFTSAGVLGALTLGTAGVIAARRKPKTAAGRVETKTTQSSEPLEIGGTVTDVAEVVSELPAPLPDAARETEVSEETLEEPAETVVEAVEETPEEPAEPIAEDLAEAVTEAVEVVVEEPVGEPAEEPSVEEVAEGRPKAFLPKLRLRRSGTPTQAPAPKATRESIPEIPVDTEPPVVTGATEEVVTTESGMMNLAALQAGRGFPSRRAMRDAEKRGVEALVVDGRRYETRTGEIPVVEGAPEDALRRRTRKPLSWEEMVKSAEQQQAAETSEEGS